MYHPPIAEYPHDGRLLGHRRLRLPRHEDPVRGRPLLLRRLLLRSRLEPEGRRTARRRACGASRSRSQGCRRSAQGSDGELYLMSVNVRRPLPAHRVKRMLLVAAVAAAIAGTASSARRVAREPRLAAVRLRHRAAQRVARRDDHRRERLEAPSPAACSSTAPSTRRRSTSPRACAATMRSSSRRPTGKTEALDASTGRVLWRFTPSAYAQVAGSAQITNATPALSTDRTAVYAAAPDGRIRKLRALRRSRPLDDADHASTRRTRRSRRR